MSNFKCDKCGTTLIDCGLGVFKTPKEIELERKLEIAEEALFMISHISYSGSGKEVEGYYRGITNKALQKMKEVSNE